MRSSSRPHRSSTMARTCAHHQWSKKSAGLVLDVAQDVIRQPMALGLQLIDRPRQIDCVPTDDDEISLGTSRGTAPAEPVAAALAPARAPRARKTAAAYQATSGTGPLSSGRTRPPRHSWLRLIPGVHRRDPRVAERLRGAGVAKRGRSLWAPGLSRGGGGSGAGVRHATVSGLRVSGLIRPARRFSRSR